MDWNHHEKGNSHNKGGDSLTNEVKVWRAEDHRAGLLAVFSCRRFERIGISKHDATTSRQIALDKALNIGGISSKPQLAAALLGGVEHLRFHAHTFYDVFAFRMRCHRFLSLTKSS